MRCVSPEGCVAMSQAIQSEDVCRGDEVEAVSGRGNAQFGPQRVFFIYLFIYFLLLRLPGRICRNWLGRGREWRGGASEVAGRSVAQEGDACHQVRCG